MQKILKAIIKNEFPLELLELTQGRTLVCELKDGKYMTSDREVSTEQLNKLERVNYPIIILTYKLVT